MTFFRRYLALLLAVLSQAALADGPVPWTADELAWAKAHSGIVVGTYDEGYPPFERLQDGALVGLAPDYLTAILKPLGITWTARVYPSPEALYAGARRGEVDLVMDVSPSEHDLAGLKVGSPYFESSAVAVVRRDQVHLAQPAELDDGRIAVHEAYMEEAALRKAFPHATILYAKSISDALKMVVNGRATAYVEDRNTIEDSLARLQLGDVLTTGDAFSWSRNTLSFAVSPHDAMLGQLIDKGLARLDVDEQAHLRFKWLGKMLANQYPHDTVQLTHEERAWLASLPPLKVAIDPGFVPFNVVSSSGKIEGLSADYLKLIAKDLGVTFETAPSGNWSETLASIKQGNIDILGAMNPDGRAAPYMVASSSYISFPIMLVVREHAPSVTDLDDLHGKTLLANPDRAADADIVARLDDAKLIKITSTEEGMRRLAEGEGDALVVNLASADYLISKKYAGVLKIAAPAGGSESMAIGVRRGLEPLIPLINRSLNRLTPRERQSMKNTWFAADYHYTASWREIVRKLMPFLAAGLLVLIVLSYAYIKLRREVRRRRLLEEQLDEVVDNLPAVVFKLVRYPDGQRRFTYLGGDPEPVIGMSAEEILEDKSPVLHTVHEDDRALLRNELDRSARDLSPLRLTIRATVRGAVHYVKSQAKPHRNLDGSTYWSGFWSDVTHEHEQAQALASARDVAEDATKAKSEFLATMSHEIRTPMNGVIGVLGVLSKTNLDRQQKHLLGTVSESTGALLHILNDILDYSKVESGEMHFDTDVVDLRQLVDSVTAVMASAAHNKGLLLRVHVGRDVSQRVMADEGRLRQVMLNLLSNAIKFTKAGSVSLGLEALDVNETQQTLKLSVRDTGVGISEGAQRDIFRPFVQVDASITHQFGGTGLGLSICRRLTELMGGKLTLESAPGSGTLVTATVVLPVAHPIAAAREESLLVRLDIGQTNTTQAIEDCLVWLGATVVAADPGDGSPVLVFSDQEDTSIDSILISDAPMAEGFSIDGSRVSISTNPLRLSALGWVVAHHRHPDVSGARQSHHPKEPVTASSIDYKGQKRALVVDDHSTNREVLSLMLNDIGITSDAVGNGVEALARLADTSYDIVLTDCHMPMMDGYAMTRDLRAFKGSPNDGVPVVAVTADARPEQWALCQAAGMDDILHKPIGAEELDRLMQKWLPVGEKGVTHSPIEVDSVRLRSRFRSYASAHRVLSSCIEETRKAFRLLEAMPVEVSADELAEWLHHVLGGMSFVFQGAPIEQWRQVEVSLYQKGQQQQQLPQDLLRELNEAMRAMEQARDSLQPD